MMKKLGKKTNNETIGNIAIFQPFNALSNKCQDEIISKCIERLNLVNTFRSLKTRVQAISFANDAVVGISHINKSRQDIESDLKSINENIIFSNLHLLWTIRRNLILTYDLHEWFVNRRNDESLLDAKIKDTIDEFSNPKSKK